jgi:glycosyltransferase involved in cell wall biosynthesis
VTAAADAGAEDAVARAVTRPNRPIPLPMDRRPTVTDEAVTPPLGRTGCLEPGSVRSRRIHRTYLYEAGEVRTESTSRNAMDQNVSICIANYNMADTIRDSLGSVVEHVPNDYEIVIVDESDDRSREIIDELDVENPLKTIYAEDLGLSRSRNLAVEEASGDIVLTHVDMDDWYDSRYFEPLVELYVRIREARDGEDFFFSCPNFNMTGRDAYLESYKLKDLPIGPGERDYRWRVVTADEYLWVAIDADVSGRLKLSDRKTVRSRARRAFDHTVGLFVIGYSVRRILDEEVFIAWGPLYSQVYRLAILPVAFVISQFKADVESAVPRGGDSLSTEIERRTYTLGELRDRYDIEEPMQIDALLGDE